MTQPAIPEWRNSDPRIDFCDLKRVEIVILRPNIKGRGLWEPGMGWCEMKQGWSVDTSFLEHGVVGEDKEWDQDWYWIPAPRKTV